MDMGVAVVVPVPVPVGMGMAVGMVVMVDGGRGGNHADMLYYNITAVHDPAVIPGRCRASNPESRDSGLGFADPE